MDVMANLFFICEFVVFNGFNFQECVNIWLFEEVVFLVCYIIIINVWWDYFSWNIIEILRGSGLGFVWDYKGYIIINYYVI